MTNKKQDEQKFVEISDSKADSGDEEEGSSGSFSGYANNFGVLDSYDDITLPGCFKDGLDEFLNSGFTAPDHRSGIVSEIGIPVEAFEDETGVFIKSLYHPTPDAQAIRQKVNFRLANGKKVSLSIGYRTLDYEYVVGEEAAPFLKNPSQEVLTYLKERQPLVRLLKKVALKEHSVVPIGANEASEVVEGKSLIKTREEIQEERKALFSEQQLLDAGGNARRIQALNLKLRLSSAK
jgi:HK97 family phage prohead protease